MGLGREPKYAGAWTKFRLLTWKNFLQQWRHRWQTAVEVLLPVVTMALVLLLRWQIEPTTVDTRSWPSIQAHTFYYSQQVLGGMNLTRLSIAYSPRSELLDGVLRSAFATLLIQNVRDLYSGVLVNRPDILELIPPEGINSTNIHEIVQSFIRLDAYDNSSELINIYADEETTRIVIAAVEFDDALFGATSLPMNLSFALRFPERPRLNSFYSNGGRTWRTDAVFPFFEIPGPRFPWSWTGGNDPGYVNELFIAIQHSISMELISRVTGEDLREFDVALHRFPHPPYVYDLAVNALQFLFPSFILLSFSYTAVNIIRAVAVEKELQLKETMKVMGLPSWLHWTAWFFKQFVYLLFATVLILVLLKVHWFTAEDGFQDYAVFTNTPWTVLLFYLLLYMSCMIFFCFMISGFFSKGSTAALSGGVIWFMTYIPAVLLSMDVTMSPAVQALTCLSINSAMSYGFQLLLAAESTGGLQWGQFFASPAVDSPRFLFGHVVLMLVLDCVVYMLVALYLEQIMPGPYGTPQPWNFLFQKQYWCGSSKPKCDIVIANDDNSDITKEKDPINHNVGVKMSNLTKVYGKHVAVNNLSLNIYDDQITVLLGHNGAGKSTTISMLTGNLEITRGSVTVAGYDMTSKGSAARSHIGLCPQHNVLFNELTVREHLEFFARLKGFKGQQLDEEIDTLIEKLELQGKRNYQAGGLSGGQKRRLCVGIALSGAARVVLLDEPTSGMDPASRRALWDLLQKEKKGRSMILTTHFMDEADILGDRVAIMAGGRLQCVGSPYFLKRHYGVGYTLVVVKDEGFQPELCTDLINRYIPGTTIKEDRGTEVTYSITHDYSHAFEAMLTDLESNKSTIKFKNYGLVTTTLEDVFMSVGSDVLPPNADSDEVMTTSTEASSGNALSYAFESSLEKLNKDDSITGLRLLWQHTIAVWTKLWLLWTRSWQLLLLQLAVPALLMNAFLGAMRYVISFTVGIERRPLSLEQGMQNIKVLAAETERLRRFTKTETFLNFNGTMDSSVGALAKTAYEMMFTSANIASMGLTVVNNTPLDDYYLERGADAVQMGMMRHRVLTGATFSDNSATAWFSNFGYHDVATSLAAVHAALLRAYRPEADLKVYNHPLNANYRDQSNQQIMVRLLSMQLSNGIGSSIGIVSAVFIMFYIKERVSRAKLLQEAAGISPATLWLSAALYDWAWFLIISVSIPISCAAFQVMGLSTAGELGQLYVCLMVFAAAMLPMVYCLSHCFNKPALGFVAVFFINLLFGMIGTQIVEALLSPQLDTKEVAQIMDYIMQFFPLYSLITATRQLTQVGLQRWSCLQGCDYISAIQPNLTECTMQAMCTAYPDQCCVPDDPFWDWNEPGVLRYLACMVATCAVMWALLMFTEFRVYRKIFSTERCPPPIDEFTQDEDVVDEANHARTIGSTPPSNVSLTAVGLSKYYGKNLAVDQVSFTVGDKECFGLLGVNGAGKTTTFKMLMGDETVSSGDAYISGHSVRKDITKVYENIGYCPQFDAVFGEMTGRENLRFFSRLRGIPPGHAAAGAEALAHVLGFTKHLDKRVDQYSGGNKRKLSTAVALLGRTRLVFMDEPTTGVDPAAKRQMWNVIRGAQQSGRGFVLTSHSMEECEALCSRLTIMVNGRFQCLGTPQHLKNKFSQGFTLTIKMKTHDDATSVSTDIIKEYINSSFADPKIMEEYQGLLTYYLPDRSMAWSAMFGVMERAKTQFAVEDYSIAQTTLEQIFLQFTKYQREDSD